VGGRCGECLCGAYGAPDGLHDGIAAGAGVAIGIGDEFEHAWGVLDRPPGALWVEAQEQVAREQGSEDVGRAARDEAVASANDEGWEVGVEVLFDAEVMVGAELGVGVGGDDAPSWTATARHGGRSVVEPRILLGGI
jgi:hypothetical protein